MINVKIRSISPEVSGTDKQLGPVFQDEAWIAYRTKWNEFPQNEIVGEVPLQLDLYVVDVCNLKCPMCTRQIFSLEESSSGFSKLIFGAMNPCSIMSIE